MTREDLLRARKRALRAAQVATIGLALATTPACGDTGGGEGDGGSARDAFVAMTDSGSSDDAATPGTDAGAIADAGPARDAGAAADGGSVADGGRAQDAGSSADAAVVGDAGCVDFPPTTEECCNLTPDSFWDPSAGMCFVAVPGPFVPPSMSV